MELRAAITFVIPVKTGTQATVPYNERRET